MSPLGLEVSEGEALGAAAPAHLEPDLPHPRGPTRAPSRPHLPRWALTDQLAWDRGPRGSGTSPSPEPGVSLFYSGECAWPLVESRVQSNCLQHLSPWTPPPRTQRIPNPTLHSPETCSSPAVPFIREPSTQFIRSEAWGHPQHNRHSRKSSLKVCVPVFPTPPPQGPWSLSTSLLLPWS